MGSCVICILRILSCTFTNQCCCSVCLWFFMLILLCVFVSIILSLSIYSIAFVLFILNTCALLVLENGESWCVAFTYCVDAGWTFICRVYFQYTKCICNMFVRSRNCCTFRKRRVLQIIPINPSIVIVESCDNTIMLGIECQHKEKG